MRTCFAVALLILGASCHFFEPLEEVDPRPTRIVYDSSISLSAAPTSIAHGQDVVVSWKGVSSPQRGDYIAVYLAKDNITATAPVKYQYTDFDKNYQTGSGSLKFRLMNMRADYIFYFFRGGVKTPVLAAKSNIVTMLNHNQPLQGRLALTGNSGEMMVSWTSLNSSTPVVKYGSSPTSLTQTVSATSYTYTREEMCGEPATTIGYRSPGTFHSAIIKDLKPDQHIFYMYGDANTNEMSQIFNFWMVPQTGDDVNIFAFGDLGQHVEDSTIVQNDMAASRNTTDAMQVDMSYKHLVLHIGDISYARGYVSTWDHFHDQIEPISTRMAWMTGIGNHERDWPGTGTLGGTDSGGECGVAYETRFPMPTSAKDKPWYSFDIGVLHIIIMSTEQDFSPSSEQYDFFKTDLASVNRTLTPWVIFAGHRPMYIDSTYDDPGNVSDQAVATAMKQSFEQLLFDNKVDLIFGAHHHSYQRTCPVFQNQCREAGADGYAAPVVVDIGMAGAGNSENIEHPQPEIYQFVDDTHHGYTRIFATKTEFKMEYVRGDDRHVHDSFTLTKS